MPGPVPKPEGARRRRNSGSKPRRLPVSGGKLRKVPALPGKTGMLPATRAWWATVWASPMAAVYIEADVPALARLAGLLDRVQRGDTSSRLLGEVRALEDRFGLSPLSRRRLQWELEPVVAAPPPRDGEERWLRAVSD